MLTDGEHQPIESHFDHLLDERLRLCAILVEVDLEQQRLTLLPDLNHLLQRA